MAEKHKRKASDDSSVQTSLESLKKARTSSSEETALILDPDEATFDPQQSPPPSSPWPCYKFDPEPSLKAVSSTLDGEQARECEHATLCHKCRCPLFTRFHTSPPRTLLHRVYRGSQLSSLEDALDNPNGLSSLIRVSAVVTGAPGIGKTELVIHAIEKTCWQFYNVLWINGSNNDSIRKCFVDIASKLKCDTENLDIDTIYHSLSQNRTLFVFDDVENAEILKEFLPSVKVDTNLLSIIVTSRHLEWEGVKKIHLECFTAAQSQELLNKILPHHLNTDLKILAEKLGNHPSALYIVASYIKSQNKLFEFNKQSYTVKNFIIDFKLDVNEMQPLIKNVKEEIFKIWDTALENVSKFENASLCLKILDIISYLAPDNIPVSILKSMCDNDEEQSNITNALQELKSNSLISSNENTGNISITKLLQKIVRKKCTSQEQVTSELMEIFYNDLDDNEFSNCNLSRHAKKVWKFVSNNDFLINKYSEIPTAIVHACDGVMNFVDAIDFVDKYIDKLESVLGWRHLDFLNLYNEYVLILKFQDKIYCEKCVEITDKVISNLPEELKDHEYYEQLLDSRALVFKKLKKYVEAWEIWIEIYQKHRYETDEYNSYEDMITELFETAVELDSENKPEPLQTCVKILEERAVNKNVSANYTLSDLEIIAEHVFKTNKYECIELYSHFYDIFSNTYEPSHYSNLKLLALVAKCLYQLEKFEDAWKYYSQIIGTQQLSGDFTMRAFEMEFETMCKVAIELDKLGKPLPLKMCILHVKLRIQDKAVGLYSTFDGIHEIICYVLHTQGVNAALEIEQSFHSKFMSVQGCSHPMTSLIHLRRVLLFQFSEKWDECWNVIENIYKVSDIGNKPEKPEYDWKYKNIINDIDGKLRAKLRAIT